MEIWERGSIGRKWHSRTHKRRALAWTHLERNFAAVRSTGRRLAFDNLWTRRPPPPRDFPHPRAPLSGVVTPPKQAEVARLMRPPRGNQGISGKATRYIYIRILNLAALAPSRSRFRSRYEIVRDNYAANRPAIRYGNRISEMSEENIEDSPRFWKFSHLSSYLLSGKIGEASSVLASLTTFQIHHPMMIGVYDFCQFLKEERFEMVENNGSRCQIAVIIRIIIGTVFDENKCIYTCYISLYINVCKRVI